MIPPAAEATPFRVACVQVNATEGIADNLEAARLLVSRAAAEGASLIALPECVALMAATGEAARSAARREAESRPLAVFRELAAGLGRWLLVGSLPILPEPEEGQDSEDHRIVNRSILIDGEGVIRARYDKIHMFDVRLGGGGTYRESATYRPGSTAVLAETPFGPMGLTICYDLRFPGLYRSLARAGCRMIAVPSAFTRMTGAAHWHVLLRARAIETGCFIIAPAQCGAHPGGRQTYGHALIVDPWGTILAEADETPGVVAATLDPDAVTRARRQIPSLAHDRAYAAPVPAPGANL